MANIVNLNKERYDVYIGRPSKWGNPFTIGKDGTRTEVIQKYKQYFYQNLVNDPELILLKDKTLGCYCKPKACHGDIIVEYLHSYNEFLS